MSYATALARVHELEARFGINVFGNTFVDNRSFDTVLQRAQSKFAQGPDRYTTPVGTVDNLQFSDEDASEVAALGRAGGRGAARGLTPQLSMTIERIARKHGVPAALVKAVARAESGFRSDAVSPAGAQGMMQLMPATGRGLGVTDPFDAEQSIEGGTRYLKNALRIFGGDVKLAVASYNAGVGAVQRYHGVPPYNETQDYVRKVLAYSREFGLNSTKISL